jgi:MFS family permease
MTAMTYMTLPAIMGPVVGPLLGGVITTWLSWRWIFYVNVPIGLVGIVLAMRFVENIRDYEQSSFDFPGFLMVGIGLGLLQFGMENVSQPVISLPMIGAAIGLASLLLFGFGLYARKVVAPAVDLSLFHLRSFRVGTLAGGLARVGLNGMPFLLPLMLQVGFGLSPIVSGSITFIGSVGALFVRALLAPVLRTHGFKAPLVGSAIAGSLSLVGFAFLTPATPHWIILACVFVFGLCRSAQFMTSNTLSYADLPERLLSRATSLGGALQQLSVSFGVSAGAVLLSLVSLRSHTLTPGRFHEVFLLSAIIPLLAVPGFLTLRPEDGAPATSAPPRAPEVA